MGIKRNSMALKEILVLLHNIKMVNGSYVDETSFLMASFLLKKSLFSSDSSFIFVLAEKKRHC